jgi:hypothetical protein
VNKKVWLKKIDSTIFKKIFVFELKQKQFIFDNISKTMQKKVKLGLNSID